MRKAWLVVVVFTVFPATATASTRLDMPDGPARALYTEWLRQSAMPTPNRTVRVILENYDSGHMAGMQYVNPSRRRPEGTDVILRFPDLSYLAAPGYEPGQLDSVHATFMHEIGHVFDWEHRRDRGNPLRRGFLRRMAFEGTWFSMDTPHEVNFDEIPPVETFADAYADCAVPGAVYANYQGYGTWVPAVGQRASICGLIQRAAAHRWGRGMRGRASRGLPTRSRRTPGSAPRAQRR